ncbi:acetyl-CoA carboxylase biotin carboxylase subunit [Variovorax sp. PBL-E5]|uniref:acetyl-CoA carboxylase biotin carboxylase subunit n=1 Tax=Variovorax sp. PBL-E5 TaxID=434014 RepID=UPI0013183F47|nr:biotin carboxylase N-terminal domain-containing protein [Variovorax sp. PBL-E5]VTU38350.1 Acetyl-/propionyl-coenzyme A carboxylase alpha chain [Variovorax sp. PBL-E5]
MAAFHKVLVANRGAVASRVIRALRQLGIASVAVHSEADRDLPYVAEADQSVGIGPAAPRESYLCIEKIIDAARETGADAIHPGYGFLAENADFAQRVIDAGLCFIGPSPKWIREMGHKTHARKLAQAWGLPTGRGTDVIGVDDPDLHERAAELGFPVMVKPAAGGGGIGMLRVDSLAQLDDALRTARSAAERGFGVGDVYLEKLLVQPRHVEIQLIGDAHGNVAHLFDRDCSVQRRNQKVIEEAPAPGIAASRRLQVITQAAAALAKAGYDNIGTLEMLLSSTGEFSFLEMNTRLQVEHGVTEEVTGVDLVAAQIRSAAGERLPDILPPSIDVRGHAIEARVCAEDPLRFFPSTGTLATFRPPSGEGIRIETGYAEGNAVTPFYDSLIAKVIVHAPTRDAAIGKLSEALAAFDIAGVKTNIPAIQLVLASDDFQQGQVHTGLMQACIDAAKKSRSST